MTKFNGNFRYYLDGEEIEDINDLPTFYDSCSVDGDKIYFYSSSAPKKDKEKELTNKLKDLGIYGFVTINLDEASNPHWSRNTTNGKTTEETVHSNPFVDESYSPRKKRLKAESKIFNYLDEEKGIQRFIDSYLSRNQDETEHLLSSEANKKRLLEGVKETEGKLNYELDWNFIEQMAQRMAQNKGKYEPFNWMKPIDVEQLKQALFRHVIAMMKGEYSDDGREFGHLESISINAMMINYQLKNKK